MFPVGSVGDLDEEVARRELNYIATVLSEDGKNYHMWSSSTVDYSKVASDQMYLDEIKFSHELIAEDCRNNSAWNQLWFAVHKELGDILPADTSHREADMMQLKLQRLIPTMSRPGDI
jgi:protein farnesyltransferase/geranylgeranyltransferase type-1 subunit alpha